MGKYLITGRPGSGKTTVIKELRKRGYAAYNTDDLPRVTRLEDKQTGNSTDWPSGPVDWSRHAWNWQKTELQKLLKSADSVFVGAVVSNQEQFYRLFDKIFVLTLSSKTLRGRLERHDHVHNRQPEDIKRILTSHEIKQRHFIEDGAIPIPSDQPVSKVADEILSYVHEN